MAKGNRRDGKREARWRQIVQGQKHSGVSVREFCRRQSIPESAFYHWRRELRQREQEQRRQAASAAATFVPVRVTHDVPAPSGRIEIVLSGGQRVHVTAPVDRQALADVLLAVSEAERAVLEGRPC